LAGLYIGYVIIVAKLKPELAPPLSEKERYVPLPPLLEKVAPSHGARALPPLTRARLRAAGEVTELDATQLAFSQDEASRLLETLAGRSIDAAAVESFQAQTEGWVVGLRLLAACSADRGARPLPGRERRSQQLLFDFLIQADHVQGCGFALINLARIYRWQGRLAETELLLENVLAERGLHPDALTLRLLNALTLHHVYTMKLDRAEQTGQLYLALAQESGLKLSQGFAHSVLGCVACLRNQVEQADSQFSILLLKTTPSVSGIVVWLRICRPPAIRAQAGGTCAPARLATCLVDSLETRR